ncbi:MAG: Rho termination factor N-terminal domain-containing protein [Bacilli bacterium]
MEKALETVKRKEERPRRFDNRNRSNNRGNFRSNDHQNDRRERYHDSRKNAEQPQPRNVEKETVEQVKPVETVKAPVKPVEKVATIKVEKAEVKDDLTKLTVAELREMAKAKNIKGFSTMKKSELVDALK